MALILIVDDEKGIRRMLRRVLQEAGHHVIEASDGVKALALCRSVRPDLLICDLFMPQQGGLETIRKARKDDLCGKIIAVSGGSSIFPGDFLDVAKKLGADLVFRKPFSMREVIEAVDRLLAERGAQLGTDGPRTHQA